MRVVLVEDDAALSLFLRKGLELEGNVVTCFSDGQAALTAIEERTPDLVVLDLNLPNMDGVEVLRGVRQHCHDVAVLVLTGRSTVGDRVACLDLGADDYLLKPFSFHELLARCRAVTRRKVVVSSSVVRHGDLQVDRVTRAVSRANTPVELTTKEFSLLDYLLQNRGRAVSRPELLDKVWRTSPDAGTNVVDVYVNYLRRKLSTPAAVGELIETVRGAGYTISPALRSTSAVSLPAIMTSTHQWGAAA